MTFHLRRFQQSLFCLWALWPAVALAAPSPELLQTMSQQKYTPEYWTQQYCSPPLGYCVALHKNFWYKSFLNVPGNVAYVEFSAQLVENIGDGPIVLRIVPGALQGSGVAVEDDGSVLKATFPRDAVSHFVIEGPLALAQPIRYMAEHITLMPAIPAGNAVSSQSAVSVVPAVSPSPAAVAQPAPVSVMPVMAKVFPDVAETSPYYEAVMKLAELGVVQGNPDGKYYPLRKLNRAEMLVLLYRTIGVEPPTPLTPCFADVPVTAWFAAVVCHATRSGYVQGYPDGRFRPENPVTKAESLKMVLEVLDLPLTTDLTVLKKYNFSDVDAGHWYGPYVATALLIGVLEAPAGDRLNPGDETNRGEAALYIFNALYPPEMSDEVVSPSAPQPTPPTKQSPEESGNGTMLLPDVAGVPYSFTTKGVFHQKEPVVLPFTVKKTTTIYSKASINDAGTISCRLYRLESSGFSQEYYLGIAQGKECSLLTTLTPGNYQLQLQGSVADAQYLLAMHDQAGDGNDGFSQAVSMQRGAVRTGKLEEEDLEDWYTFPMKTALSMTVETSGAEVDCIIYALSDVDLYGFKGPECNQSYQYPPGTYMISVRKMGDARKARSYDLRLK